VLVASANPIDTDRLALDEEVRDITARLRATPGRDAVELRTAWAMRPLDLLSELNEHAPAVVHFSGHGTPDGRLVFLDATGQGKPVTGQALSATLVTAAESVRVVVLNACFSAELARALTEHIDVAVGMNRPVGDDAARVFASAFYTAIGYGASVQRAFGQGRAALMLQGIPEEHTPQLYARAGVNPDELVLVDVTPDERPGGARAAVEADLAVLRKRSTEHLGHLARHAALPVGEGVRLERALAEPLRRRAEDGSLLVVGQPGIGKTGAMHRLAVELGGAGHDIVVLAADLLGSASSHGLRDELGLQRALPELLSGWAGEGPGFLLIDAIDAARGQDGAAALLALVQQVAVDGGRWHVVASVRSFDLRHNPDLQDAIPAAPDEHGGELIEPEFSGVRHVAVGGLSDAELAELAGPAPQIHAFLMDAPIELRELVRNPFNLRLLVGLFERDGVDSDRLRTVRTQLELLDLYWGRRVLSPAAGGDARELIALRLCERAADRMRLQVARADLREHAASAGEALDELLSAGVLVELRAAEPGQVERLGFVHHLLFDYAVHRLLLAGEPDAVAHRLAEREELVLLARPGLVLTLIAAWESNAGRAAFWQLAGRLAREDVPTTARLVAPAVAVEQAHTLDDLRPLLQALDRDNEEPAFLLRHLVGARAAMGQQTRPLADADLGLWAELARELADRLSPKTVYPARLLVWGLSGERDRLDTDTLAAFGRAARALLAWAWEQDPHAWQEVELGLETVARSCATEPATSVALLRRVIDRARLPEHGFRELRPVAEQIPSLVDCDPEFVSELYEAGFGHVEISEEATAFGSGQILAMTSTRRQDWEMARYALRERYPAVLRAAPQAAVRALAAACRTERDRYGRRHEPEVRPLRFRGAATGLEVDRSGTWDDHAHHGDDIPAMLDAFQARLATLAREGDRTGVDRLLDAVAAEARPAAIWRRVLRAGTDAPVALASPLAELLAAPVLLASSDTSEPAGGLLGVAAEHLEPPARERIERAILGLPGNHPAEHHEVIENLRDALLTRPSPELLVTDEARARRADLDAHQGAAAELLDRPRIQRNWGAVDPDDELRGRGINPDADANRRLLALLEPVKAFAADHSNSSPDREQADAGLPAIRAVRDALAGVADGVDLPLIDEARAWLSEAASALAGQTPLPLGHDSIALARELALAGVDGTLPIPDSHGDENDERGPIAFSVPSGRIDAAQALLRLAREAALIDPELLDAVDQLSRDPVTSVRATVARHLAVLVRGAPERGWARLERMAVEEPNALVSDALLHSLRRVVPLDLERAMRIAREMYEREKVGRARESLLSELAEFLFDGWIWDAHPAGRRLADEWVADMAPPAAVAHGVFHRQSNAVTHGDGHPEHRAVRQRALGLWADLTRAANDQFVAAHQRLQEVGQPAADPELDTLRSLGRVLDAVGLQLYFASGAYAERNKGSEDRLAPDVRARFYREAHALFEVMLHVGVPRVVHHVLETLSTYIEHDPRGVLLRIGRLLEAGSAWGYQTETLAEQEFVALVERYLASQRELLLGDRECRAVLVHALERFVEAGWPSARRLLYGLDDMFR
jgi:hypothetical protein